jgi:hypothetical protein
MIIFSLLFAVTAFFPGNSHIKNELGVDNLPYDRQIDIKRVQYTNPERNTFLFMGRHKVFEIPVAADKNKPKRVKAELIYEVEGTGKTRPVIQSFAYIPPRWDFGDFPDGFFLISTLDKHAEKGKLRRVCLVGRKKGSKTIEPQGNFYFLDENEDKWTQDVSFSRIVSTYSGEHILVSAVADQTLEDTSDWTVREINIFEDDGSYYLTFRGQPFVRSENLFGSWLGNFRLFWAFEDEARDKGIDLLAIGELTTVIDGLVQNEDYYSSVESQKIQAPFKTKTAISLRMNDYVRPYENTGLPGRVWYYSFDRISGIYPAPNGYVLMGIQKPKPGFVWGPGTKNPRSPLSESPFILTVSLVDPITGEITHSLLETPEQEFLIGTDGNKELYTLLQDPSRFPSFWVRVYEYETPD